MDISLIEKMGLSSTGNVIISLSLILFLGFLMTRLTKAVKLPNVTAYLICGILLGPFVLNVVPSSFIKNSSFLPDIALAFIAFGAGEFFKFDVLKKSGKKVIIISIFEAVLSILLTFIVTYFILRLDLAFCILLSSLACATAPASTMMTIRQTGARGEFVNTLLQVIALDNIIALSAYSIAISVAKVTTLGGDISLWSVLKPIILNVANILIGGLFGFFLKFLIPESRSNDNKLIISIAMLFAFCGICTALGQSPLLGCMSMGMIYINLTKDDRVFKQLAYFSPPILLLFFVRSGLNFDLSSLVSPEGALKGLPLLVIGIIFFAIRNIGKYFGSFTGVACAKGSKEERNYLGFALIPQASVAIGLAALGARALTEAGDPASASALETIVLSAAFINEIIGPAVAKLSLSLSKSIPTSIDDVVDVSHITSENNVDLLIRQIEEIKKTIPEHHDDSEDIFTEAAYDQYNVLNYNRNRRRR